MKLSKIIEMLQVDLATNGDAKTVGICVAVGLNQKRRIDAFSNIEVCRDDANYPTGMTYIVGDYLPVRQADPLMSNVIMMKGHSHASSNDAQDTMAGTRSIPGFIAGYIDNKEHRVISFHIDTHPEMALKPSQQRVQLTMP